MIMSLFRRSDHICICRIHVIVYIPYVYVQIFKVHCIKIYVMKFSLADKQPQNSCISKICAYTVNNTTRDNNKLLCHSEVILVPYVFFFRGISRQLHDIQPHCDVQLHTVALGVHI